MLDLLTVTLEAHSPQENHHRRYQVTVGRDLLNDWTVAVTYGRTGQAGRELRYADPQPEAIRRLLRACLRRRFSAPRRIGCSYQIAAITAADGFDVTAWIPTELMARLAQS